MKAQKKSNKETYAEKAWRLRRVPPCSAETLINGVDYYRRLADARLMDNLEVYKTHKYAEMPDAEKAIVLWNLSKAEEMIEMMSVTISGFKSEIEREGK